ncbi:MAG: hypothetical protein M5U21_02780 [Fimbriimonadaceae bacterium]|nr:hypothetical protein [Fimbriimonadaceae bacterium]
MYQTEQDSSAIDFELRRAARRRIIEVLEVHQQSEAESARMTAESLIDFYEGALKSIGKWILSDSRSQQEELLLQSFTEFSAWKRTIASVKQVKSELDTAMQIHREAEIAVNQIEPNPILRPWCNKPGMKEAKAKRDSALADWTLKGVEESRLEIELDALTRQLLSAIAAKMEEIPLEYEVRTEIENLMIVHLDSARSRWSSHRKSENEGLVEVIKLTQVLNDYVDASHVN